LGRAGALKHIYYVGLLSLPDYFLMRIIKEIKKLKKIKPKFKKPRNDTNEIWKTIKKKIDIDKEAEKIYEENVENSEENFKFGH
jgi:hypothetical protein